MNRRSGVSWLSSSSAEIARARHVLKSLTLGGTIDELGFLVLQGAFADVFYPAVTTPMTRARYFVFVPAIYRYLEESGEALARTLIGGPETSSSSFSSRYEMRMTQSERRSGVQSCVAHPVSWTDCGLR